MPNHCVIEIFVDGRWQEAASVQLRGVADSGYRTRSVCGYDDGWAYSHEQARDGWALCSAMPVSYATYSFDAWPPFLIDLLPQGFGRRELLRQLKVSESLEAGGDWPLLLAGAGNPIGHLRVKEAAQRLQAHAGPRIGFTDEEVAERDEGFIEHLSGNGLYVSGSSGVQGEWPKVLLTRARDGRLYLDHTVPDDDAVEHFIVKFGQSGDPSRARILRHEAPYMDIANYLGLDVFKPLTMRKQVLFIPRFDRYVTEEGVLRLAQESIAVLTGQPGFEKVPSHDEVCRRLAQVSSDAFSDVLEYIKRDVANLAMGNKDNHARNTAVQRDFSGNVRLTPLFDFTPMYLHPDGIARRIRWESEKNRNPNWAHVLDAVARDTGLDRTELAQGLKDMAPALEQVLTQGADWGLETDVLAFLSKSILAQLDGLAAL